MTAADQVTVATFRKPPFLLAVEWGGCLTGLLGSYLVAANIATSGFGFLAYLTSNMLMLAYGLKTRAWGLVTMQLGFTGSSVMGIMRWLA